MNPEDLQWVRREFCHMQVVLTLLDYFPDEYRLERVHHLTTQIQRKLNSLYPLPELDEDSDRDYWATAVAYECKLMQKRRERGSL